VLNKLPKSQQSKAKRALQEIWMAESKRDALAALDAFVETWSVKYDKAAECLIKDRNALLAFCDSRPSTGNMCERPTSSKARSRRCAADASPICAFRRSRPAIPTDRVSYPAPVAKRVPLSAA
jgi:transposase-like protein